MGKKGKGKKGKGKKEAVPFDQAEFDKTMSTLPAPTPLPTEEGAGPICRVNELVLVKFAQDPEGLVRHLRALPPGEGGGLDAANECGWTCLMRAARDGLKKHVEALVNAGASVSVKSTAEAKEKGVTYLAGSTAADLCKLRHSSLSHLCRAKELPGGKDGTSPQESMRQNADEILSILGKAATDEDEGGEDVGASRFDERLKLRHAPNYFSVPCVQVNQGIFVDDWSA